MTSKFKKCVVVDLDNTLWGGVIGEDGMRGIELSLDGVGAGFIAFQQALLDLYHRGVILAINSHNNPDDALQVIRTHPNMILKENHFAAMRINWDDKAENIKSLAHELSIGLDAMVFFDDNPLHRESVRTFLPEVDVPELPVDSHLYTKTLHSLTYFPSAATTDEDAMRGNLYVTERLRKSAEKNFTEREDFLKDLGLEIYVSCNDTSSVPRIAQLTEKTNQFNTHKTPLNEEDVLAYMSNPEHKAFTMRVIDRFGDYGIVGVALVTIQGDTWNVDQLLLSCRILSRGAEDVFVATIATAARDSGASALSFSYKETEKNAPAKNFLAKLSNAPYQIDLTTTTVSVPRYITECHYSE